MAKKSGGKGANSVPSSNIKNEDIITPARSTMGPESYQDGYPARPGRLANMNYAGVRPGSKKGE